MRRHGYGISVFGAIVLCCLFFCFPAQSDDNAVSIRVGYYEDGDYMSRGRSAEYIGFNIEFLQKLAKVGGMRYEMLDEGSWENAWHQLLEGHIDMIPAVFRTEEREKEVLFSNLPMGTLYVTLNVRVDDKRYGYEDFSSFQGMRVGIIRVTRQTVLCTTPFSFGMKKLGKSILWHTVCINKKAGACSRLFVYAVFIRSAAILAYSGESSMPTHLLPVAFAARAVEPPPRKGSSTVPPSGTTPMSSAMS